MAASGLLKTEAGHLDRTSIKIMRNYEPTTASRTRMCQAIEKENEREYPSYAHATIIFSQLQHAANEGTHLGHWAYFKKLYEMHGEPLFTNHGE